MASRLIVNDIVCYTNSLLVSYHFALIKRLSQSFRQQRVSVEAYITMLGGSPDILGYKSKTVCDLHM